MYYEADVHGIYDVQDNDWDDNWESDVSLADINFEEVKFNDSAFERENADVINSGNAGSSFSTHKQETNQGDASLFEPQDESIIGEDVYKYKSNPEYSAVLASALSDVALSLRAASHVRKLLDFLSVDILNKASFKVVSSYDRDFSFVRSLIKEEEDDEPFGAVLLSNCINWLRQPAYERFEKWLTIGPDDILGAVILDQKLDDRMLEILQARTLGDEKLEQIGKSYNISRERVRQIAASGQRMIHQRMLQRKIADLVLLRYDVKGFVTIDDLKHDFGDCWWIIYGFLKNASLWDVQFDSHSNTFWLCTKDELENLKRLVKNLPERFEVNKLAALLFLPHVKELHSFAVGEYYNRKGGYYYSRKTSVEHICEAVLRERFPEGVHIHDEDELTRFRKIATERYGSNNLPATSHALGNKISEVGVMCDKGKYRIKQDRYISDYLIQRLYRYLTSGDKGSYSYKELFEAFEIELRQQGVMNRYYLQGILKETIGRDNSRAGYYIFFGGSSVIICDQNTPRVSRKAFSVDDTCFFSTEIDFLRKEVDSCVADGRYVHYQEMYDIIARKSRYLLERNNVLFPQEFYILLRWLFRDEYFFDSPYIARKRAGAKWKSK